MAKSRRLDLLVVELGLAPSRAKAQAMIVGGEIEVKCGIKWTCVKQSSFPVLQTTHADIRARGESEVLKFVSRGGLKLQAALVQLEFSVRGLSALDVGISTGGFTDCLLQGGARKVFGVDVGHGQLAPKLLTDSRLHHFEGVNAKDLAHHGPLLEYLRSGVDLCVADLSFISIQKIIPALAEVLPIGCHLLALVKPQFEVGPKNLDDHGIVRDVRLFVEVETQVLRTLKNCGFSVLKYFPSQVKGQDGNQEFFVLALRS